MEDEQHEETRAFEINYSNLDGQDHCETIEAEDSGQAANIFWERHEDDGAKIKSVVEL